MKRFLFIVLLGAFFINAKAQHITDFCYVNGFDLETYSDNQIVSNLKNRGFKVIKKQPVSEYGGGEFLITVTEYTLKKGGTIVYVGDGPRQINFANASAARSFATQACNIGWFYNSERNNYNPSYQVGLGVDGFKLSGKTLTFFLSVP